MPHGARTENKDEGAIASTVYNFAPMFNQNEFSDIKFVFEDGEAIHAHRVLLVSYSEYFRKLFASGFKEGKDKVSDLITKRVVYVFVRK